MHKIGQVSPDSLCLSVISFYEEISSSFSLELFKTMYQENRIDQTGTCKNLLSITYDVTWKRLDRTTPWNEQGLKFFIFHKVIPQFEEVFY